MSPRFVLPAVLVAAALTLTGCGSDGDSDSPAAAETPLASASATPSAKAKAGKGKKAKDAEAAPSVAPEVVVPSTSDSRTAFAPGDWQGSVVAALTKVDPRLTTDQVATIKKVRATCKQMETGMFSTKVVPIIMKRFSTAKIEVSYDMAEDIYSVLLGEACYTMVESPQTS